MAKQNLPDGSIVVGEKFLVGRTLGEGSFGQIQLGTNIETGDYVAIKIVIIITDHCLMMLCRKKPTSKTLSWRMKPS